MVHLDWVDHTDHTDVGYTDWDDYSDDDCYHNDWEDHNDSHSDWDDHCNDAYSDWDDHSNWVDGWWVDHDDTGGHVDWTDHGDVPYLDWDDGLGAHQDWTDYTDSGGDPHSDWSDYTDWDDHNNVPYNDWTDHSDIGGHTDWTDAYLDWDDHNDVPYNDWNDHGDYPDGGYYDWDDWYDGGGMHVDHDDHSDSGGSHQDWTDGPHSDWDDWDDGGGSHVDHTDHNDSGGPHQDWSDAHVDWTDGAHVDWDDGGVWSDHQNEAHVDWDDGAHTDWDDIVHTDWDDSFGNHQDWTDEDDVPHCNWTDHNNVAYTDWTDYSDGGIEEGKTWVSVYIDGNDLSCYVISADIWRDALNTVGRWEVVIYDPAHMWGGVFSADDDVTIRINGVLMMKGYVDDVFPFLDSSGVYKEKMRIKGRDYGMDLAQLYITAGYENQRADDIVAAALTAAGSEITYTTPSALPPTTNYEFDRTYLADGIRDLAKLVNYDLYIADDLPRTLHFFDIATMGGGVEVTAVPLRSTVGSSANNILRLEIGEILGFGIKNRIETHAGSLNDHYTELNAGTPLTDWIPTAGNTILNNGAGGVVPGPDSPGWLNGRASLIFRNVSGGALIISGELDFSAGLYEYTTLDLSESTSGRFNYLMHDTAHAGKTITFELEDSTGHIICFYRSRFLGLVKCFNCTAQSARDEWRSVDFPLGNESGIEAAFIATDKGTWYYHALSAAGTFDWTNVEKIRFGTMLPVNDQDYFLIDGLEFPNHEVISIDQDAGSIILYGTRMKQYYRPDIKSQVELDAFTADEKAKYADPAENVKITAIGQTGSEYAAQSLFVAAPISGIPLWTHYRIFKLHHQVRLSPEDNPITGYDYITEYELVLQDASIDPTRMVDVHSPTQAQVRTFMEQQRFRVLSGRGGGAR